MNDPHLPGGLSAALREREAEPDIPIWDVDVQRHFEHAHRHFQLQVAFRSHSRRLVLFGPSGAGKSQTLKIVAGLTTPDAGHVRMAGRTLVDCSTHTDVPARERSLAYLFQDYALFPHLDVAQNITFGLQSGWGNPTRRTLHPEAERWMKAFDLLPLARHYPDQLSGGQRQRTALARALVARPQALLLDEPFAALDSALRVRLRDELADLQAQLQIPLVLITHDESDVKRFGDHVVELLDGRAVTTATPA